MITLGILVTVLAICLAATSWTLHVQIRRLNTLSEQVADLRRDLAELVLDVAEIGGPR